MLYGLIELCRNLRINNTADMVLFEGFYVSTKNRMIFDNDDTEILIDSPYQQYYLKLRLLYFLLIITFLFEGLSFIVSTPVVRELFIILYLRGVYQAISLLLPYRTVYIYIKPAYFASDEWGIPVPYVCLRQRIRVKDYKSNGFFKQIPVDSEKLPYFFPNQEENQVRGRVFVTGEARQALSAFLSTVKNTYRM